MRIGFLAIWSGASLLNGGCGGYGPEHSPTTGATYITPFLEVLERDY